MTAKRGFVLPLVFGAMAVLAIFFVLMSFLSSSQTQVASHFVDSSRSLFIARAGAEWAVSNFASGTYQQNAFVEKGFYEMLFDNSGKEGEFSLQYPVEMKTYVEDELHGTLDVKVRVFDIAPLPAMGKGFQPDLTEKSGKMEFTAVGSIGKASRKVLIRKGFKLVMTVHPVLSKFNLFVRNKLPDQEVNLLERKTSSSGFENGSPIILNNQGLDANGGSKAFGVVNLTSQEFKLSEVPDLKTLVRNSGWVFLNSQTPQPWILNLSGSGGNGDYDDRILLRTAIYRNKSLETNLTMERPTGERITQLLEKFQGMKSDFETVGRAGHPVTKTARDTLALHYLFPNDPPKSSLLRIFGKGSQFSPTLVFGPVSMSYIILRGIDVVLKYASGDGREKLFKNVLIPGFPDADTFRFGFKPENAIKQPEDKSADMSYFALLLNITNRNDAAPAFPAYSQTMTAIAAGSFLDALDFIYLKDRESGTLLNPVSKTYDYPVPHVIDGNGSDLRPWIGNRDSMGQAKGAFGNEKAPIFIGSLADIEGCKEFQPRITAVFSSFQELMAGYFDEKSHSLRLPGIVFVGNDDVTIDADLQVTSPGIIISGGNIRIKSAVRSAFPLTIVSMKDIVVESGRPIDAHLICLRGKFRATGGFTITGGVAAGSMELSGMLNNEAKTITYARGHDPFIYDPELGIRKTAYRYYLSSEEEYSVEGGK